MNIASPSPPPAAKDYASDQEVRWCPGCGDYAILKAVQKTLADIEADPAKTVFVSGIGCAARFPYYLATYGFHTIHGRAAWPSRGAIWGSSCWGPSAVRQERRIREDRVPRRPCRST